MKWVEKIPEDGTGDEKGWIELSFAREAGRMACP